MDFKMKKKNGRTWFFKAMEFESDTSDIVRFYETSYGGHHLSAHFSDIEYIECIDTGLNPTPPQPTGHKTGEGTNTLAGHERQIEDQVAAWIEQMTPAHEMKMITVLAARGNTVAKSIQPLFHAQVQRQWDAEQKKGA
jgi:hypothetical protein